MSEIHIPFTHGQHEETDAKLLPQGLFSSLQNVRYRKDARLAARNAFRHDTANAAFSEANVLGVGKFDQQHHIVLQKRLGDDQPPVWARHVNGIYTDGTSPLGSLANQQAGSVGVPQILPLQVGSMANLIDAIASSDCLALGGFLWVVVSAYRQGTTRDPAPQINWFNSYMLLFKIEPATGAVLNTQYLGSDVASNLKLVNMNGNIGIFYADNANHVRYQEYNTTPTILVAPVTVVTTVAGLAPYFDVCAGAAATVAWLVYNSAANTLSFGDVSTAGAFTLKNTVATTNTGRPSIARRGLNPTDDCVIVWNDGATFVTGTTKYTIYRRSTNTFTTATTTLAIPYTGSALGYPVVAESTLDDWLAAWNVTITAGTLPVPVDAMFQTTAGQTAHSTFGNYVVSRPFTFGTSNFIGMLATDRSLVFSFPTPTTPGAYFLYDADTPANVPDPSAEAVFAIDSATPYDIQTGGSIYVENRRSMQAVPAIGIEPALGGAAMVALPFASDERGGWGLVRFEYGQYEEMFQTAALNGQLFISGSRILQYDGASLVESGFTTPRILTITPFAGTGAIANGTYSLVAVYEWHDALGNRHQSPPSDPFSVTMAGANTGMTVTVSPPLASIRNANVPGGSLTAQTTVVLKIYRTTLLAVSVYQDSGATISTTLGSFRPGFTATLLSNDATVSLLETLYTQGARGGLSGVLENDLPPPARYIWAGSDRLILGHTDNPSQYQLSKLKFPGEPINWSNTPAYRGNVDKPITGVAEMDGVYFIGTRDAIWNVGGQGPDDNGAGGTFDTPVRLPSDVGFYSAASLLLTGSGLFFQGAVDRIYVLPRGGGAPQWIGQPVRDTLALFPWITSSAYDQDSGLVYFAAVNTAGTLGRLLVYDTRIGEWSVDNVLSRAIRSLAIYNGLLVIDGSIVESTTSYQDSDGSSTASVIPTLVTGDVRPFGQLGLGRVRRVELLGEARDVTTAFSVTLDVSYDSGKTYGESVSWPIGNLALAIGDTINGADHALARPRLGGNVRYRWSWSTPSATEGIIWHGMSLDAYQAPGLKRAAGSARA